MYVSSGAHLLLMIIVQWLNVFRKQLNEPVILSFYHIFQKATERPTFKEMEAEFFGKGVENPFNLSEKGEFFLLVFWR